MGAGAGSDYAELEVVVGGALKVSGGKWGLLGGVRVSSFGEASPGWDQSAGRKRSWSKLTNGFQTQTCSRNTVLKKRKKKEAMLLSTNFSSQVLGM